MKRTMSQMGSLDINELIAQLSESANPIMYQYFKNLKNNRLLINDEIGDSAIEMYIMPLLQMDEDSEVDNITIYLSTPGGDIFTGMTLASVIENLKTKTEIIILTEAYSMGSYLTVAGRNNPNITIKCYPFTTFLIHPGQTRVAGDANAVEDTYNFVRKFNDKMKDYMLDHTTITKEEYDAHSRNEWYFTAEEMLEYGIVDEIIGVK